MQRYVRRPARACPVTKSNLSRCAPWTCGRRTQSTATSRAAHMATMRTSASRPSLLTKTATDTLSTESRFTAERWGMGSEFGHQVRPRWLARGWSSCTVRPMHAQGEGLLRRATARRVDRLPSRRVILRFVVQPVSAAGVASCSVVVLAIGSRSADDVEAAGSAVRFGRFVVLFGQDVAARRIRASRSGKIPTTSVRRRISLLSRAWRLLDQI